MAQLRLRATMAVSPMKSEPPTLETLANNLNDSDAEWWPFAFLRPQQHEHLGLFRCLALAILQGAPAALLGLLGGLLAGERIEPMYLWLFPLCVCSLLFASFRLTFARCWNRRADRLRRYHDRRTRWQRAMGEPPTGSD